MMHEWGVMSCGLSGIIFQLLFWLVIILLIIWGVKQITGRGQTADRTSKKDTALEILRERYAKGEIDRKEFEAKKKDLI